jgi:hypothetical protein
MSGALSSAACGTGNSTVSAGSGAASACARTVGEQRLPAIPGGAVARQGDLHHVDPDQGQLVGDPADREEDAHAPVCPLTRSTAPSRAPTKASHAPGVNLRTGPSGRLLSRTPISPPGRFAASTQLPLEKLRELLTHLALICSLIVTRLPVTAIIFVSSK